MLYLDGISLTKLRSELKENIANRKIRRINQVDKFSYTFQINRLNLFITINPSLPILFLKDEKDEAYSSLQPFLLSLRKCLQGSTLVDITQEGYDRILYFHFNRINELSEEKKYILVFEMMGKHSNLVLCESNMKIIDILKRFSLEENRLRLLMPNVFYKRPIIENKISPNELTKEIFQDITTEKNGIMKNVEGIGKISNNYCEDFLDFQNLINSDSKPTIYYKNGKIALAVVYDYQPERDKKSFISINELIKFYIENTIKSQKFDNLAINMRKVLNSEINKNSRILNNVERDIKKNFSYEKYKKYADILAANQYELKMGEKSKILFDFYENKNIEINLNSEMSPNANIDRYYKKYNKAKRGYFFSVDRKAEIEKEIDYLESILFSIDNSDDYNELLEIKSELIENDLMRSDEKRSKKKKYNKYEPKEFMSSEGYKILVGKNNLENDVLTFEIASRDDMWLHAKGIPGSHVIIVNPKGYPDKTIEEAAALAAYYSKGRLENLVMVDYTFKKFVNKPKKSKPGFVTYRNEKSVYIEPKFLK